MKKKINIREDIHNLKKQLILDVATELFYEKGYNGTRIEEIADRLSATKPFIYYHFKSKAEILAAVCGRTTEIAAAIAEATVDTSGPVQERLRDFVRQLSLETLRGRFYLAVYFREEKHLPDDAAQQLANNRKRFHQAVSKLLREGVASGVFEVESVSVVSQAITGMTTWVYNWYRSDGSLSPDEIADQMAILALQMVRCKITHSPDGAKLSGP